VTEPEVANPVRSPEVEPGSAFDPRLSPGYLEPSANTQKEGKVTRKSWRFRPLLTSLHRWLGISVSLYFCAMSVTGVSMVFKDELQEALTKHPAVRVAEHSAKLSEVIRKLRSSYPDQKVTGIVYPLAPAKPLLTYIQDKQGTITPILVDPGTAAILGAAPENPVLKFLQEFHFNLLANTTGRKINACGGLVLLFLSISGIVLFCRSAAYCMHVMVMKNKGTARVICWSNHQKIGVILLPMLLVWGMSAYSFGFRREFQSLVNLVLPVTALRSASDSHASEKSSETKASLPPSSIAGLDELQIIDAANDLASSQCPGQEISRIALPSKQEPLMKLWITKVHSKNKADATEVDVNVHTGTIAAVIRPESRTAGDSFLVWLPRIHFGNFAGAPSKIVWCVIGFTPLILSITGLIMWWRPKSKARSKKG
jgi:uncharacterized iron-regulated membrane protein